MVSSSHKSLRFILCLGFLYLSKALLSDLNKGLDLTTNFNDAEPTQIQIPLTANPSTYLYSFKASLGTPGQELNILVSTESSDFIVADVSGNCKGDGCGGIQNKYDPKASNTSKDYDSYKDTRPIWWISNAVGNRYFDSFSLGNITNANMSIASMINYSIPDNSWSYDGSLGLNLESKNCPIDMLLDNNLLLNASFSLYLRDPKLSGSVLVLGGIDEKYAASPFSYTKVSPYNWNWYFDSLTLGRIPYVGLHTAKVGTSTGFSIINSVFYNAILTLVPKVTSCDLISKYPTLVMKAGSATLNFPPVSYYLPDETGKTCTLGFVDGKDSYFVIGTRMISQYYVHFDLMNERIGFADAANLSEVLIDV